jgi:hypothetical protein
MDIMVDIVVDRRGIKSSSSFFVDRFLAGRNSKTNPRFGGKKSAKESALLDLAGRNRQ